MSIEASSFVLGLSMGRGNGIRKLILLGYANHADKHGRNAYPSTSTVAEYAECDVRTVRRHVGWLLANGYLREGDQRSVDHIDARYRPIVYNLAMTTDQIAQWATEAGSTASNRSRAAAVGRRGGNASARANRGDNVTPHGQDESSKVARADSLTPHDADTRGDNHVGSEVTTQTARGDIGVTQTVQEPSGEPSSSPQAVATPGAGPAGQDEGRPLKLATTAALDVLPGPVREHPSVIPGALAKHVQALHDLGWSQAEIQRRMIGVETATLPGAAALTRLADLATVELPTARPQRPPWCGQCEQRTRMREYSSLDDRPYPCPTCHPRRAQVTPEEFGV